MHVGFFTMPVHPRTRDYTAVLKEDFEAVLLAEELGYTEAFIGEHVSDPTEPITSSLLFVAALARATNRIKLGTGTVNLPNHHPAAVAAEVAMLDHLLEGRFLFGIGPGTLKSDSEIFGNLGRDRNEMFVEAIDHIIDIWTKDAPYDLRGKHWNIATRESFSPNLSMGAVVRPYQQPYPPIFATAIQPFSQGIKAAGSRGWLPITGDFLQSRFVSSHWKAYSEGMVDAGRVPDPSQWRIARTIFVADDEKTAHRYTRSPDGPYVYRYNHMIRTLKELGRLQIFKTSREMSDSDVTLDFLLDSLLISGTPDQVAQSILELREETGDFGTLLYTGHDWADPKLGRRSMELMATEVMPRVNAVIQKPR